MSEPEQDPQQDWTIVDFTPEDFVGPSTSLEAAVGAGLEALDGSSPKSQSDREADSVLGRPFSPHAGLLHPHDDDVPLTPMSADETAHPRQAGDESGGGIEAASKEPQRQPPESISALAAVISSARLQITQSAASATSTASLLFASAGEALGAFANEAVADWQELYVQFMLALEQASGQVGEAAAAATLKVKMSYERLVKALGSPSRPSWALLSMGAITAIACFAAGALWVANRKLAMQVRELASLVVRIMNLHEVLRSNPSPSTGPMLRYTSSSLMRPSVGYAPAGIHAIGSATCWA